MGEETFVETSACCLEWKGYLPIQSEDRIEAKAKKVQILQAHGYYHC